MNSSTHYCFYTSLTSDVCTSPTSDVHSSPTSDVHISPTSDVRSSPTSDVFYTALTSDALLCHSDIWRTFISAWRITHLNTSPTSDIHTSLTSDLHHVQNTEYSSTSEVFNTTLTYDVLLWQSNIWRTFISVWQMRYFNTSPTSEVHTSLTSDVLTAGQQSDSIPVWHLAHFLQINSQLFSEKRNIQPILTSGRHVI